MNILIGFLIVVEVIISLLLILIILVQPSKGSGGLGGAFGGGMGEQLFGARAGNVLTKGTILFATIFVLNTLALAWLYSRTDKTGIIETAAPAAVSGTQTPSGLPNIEVPASTSAEAVPVAEVPAAPTAAAPAEAPVAPTAEAPAAPAAEAPAAEVP